MSKNNKPNAALTKDMGTTIWARQVVCSSNITWTFVTTHQITAVHFNLWGKFLPHVSYEITTVAASEVEKTPPPGVESIPTPSHTETKQQAQNVHHIKYKQTPKLFDSI